MAASKANARVSSRALALAAEPKARWVQAFVQVDPIRGWQYLDDAGKFINQYVDTFADLKVNTEGLSMSSPLRGPIDEAKVSPRQVWTSFVLPDSFQIVVDHAVKFVRNASNTFDMADATRFGYRCQYIAEVPLDQVRALLEHLTGGEQDGDGEVTSFDVSLTRELVDMPKGTRMTTRVVPVRRGPEDAIGPSRRWRDD